MRDQLNNSFEVFTDDITNLLYSEEYLNKQLNEDTQDINTKQANTQDIDQVEDMQDIIDQEEQDQETDIQKSKEEVNQKEEVVEPNEMVVYSIDTELEEEDIETYNDNNEEDVQNFKTKDNINEPITQNIDDYTDDEDDKTGTYIIDAGIIEQELETDEEYKEENEDSDNEEESEEENRQKITEEQTNIPYYDFKGSLWRAIDFIVTGDKLNTESMGVNGIVYNSIKRNLIAVALELRQMLDKPITNVISEPVIKQVVKETTESVKKILICKYQDIKPVVEQQAINILQNDAGYITQQEARDIALSQIVYRFALDSLLLGLTTEDVKRIQEDELLRYTLRDYLTVREELFQILKPAI